MSRRTGHRSKEPLAVIGIGCRFPGGIESAAELWRFLLNSGDAISKVPEDRWSLSAIYDQETMSSGKAHSHHGAFLSDIDKFDARFFKISPREAAAIDPQQRLLLEAAWRAIEDAGLTTEKLAGSNTGVYIGISNADYQKLSGSYEVDIHSISGGAHSIAANRISHKFDLRGPSIAIDTACSSSLVALHEACSSLQAGECDFAFVGGVNLTLLPEVTLGFQRASMLSPDGRCKAFSADANGYVRGEGVGIVILRRASDAVPNRVHALVKSTFINQDGYTSTLTVPNGKAQAAMLQEACRRAAVHPHEVSYVEAHGTGTEVGDPIEASAIGTVFGARRSVKQPCLVGSIKTNIGHLEPAAGIAGLIKAVLCVKHGEIPPSLHFKAPNPNIAFDALGIRVVTDRTVWPKGSKRRTVAVNSFGFGGANACAIVQEAPFTSAEKSKISAATFKIRRRVSAKSEGPGRTQQDVALLPVSASTDSAVKAMCKAVADTIEAGSGSFEDIVGSLSINRTHLDSRVVVRARTAEEAAARLRAASKNEPSNDIAFGRSIAAPSMVFVFTGQGSQWHGMARQLLAENVVFRKAVDEFDEVFAGYSGWSVANELMRSKAHSKIDRTSVAQPALLALQIGLIAYLESMGIKPNAVIGHSIGEISAAYAAGALSLKQAVKCVYHRSMLQEGARNRGAMAAIGLSATGLIELSNEFPDIEIAAINAPELVTVAGPRKQIKQFVHAMRERKTSIFAQQLRIDYAFHSSQMEPFTAALREQLKRIIPRELHVPMFSSVTGKQIGDGELIADYWCRNMRQPVLFADAVRSAAKTGFNTFIELGPHSNLSPALRLIFAADATKAAVIATLRRGLEDNIALDHAIMALHVRGVSIDWRARAPRRFSFTDLPPTVFEKKSYWSESEESRNSRLKEPEHPLLRTPALSNKRIWRSVIAPNTPSYLSDHRVGGSIVFPAAGYVELMLAAGAKCLGEGPLELNGLTFDEALIINPEQMDVLETSISDRGVVKVASRIRGNGSEWTPRASGRVRRLHVPTPPNAARKPESAENLEECSAWLAADALYEALRQEGHDYGPLFQGVTRLTPGLPQVVGEIQMPSPLRTDGYLLHPVVLDSCFHLLRGLKGFATEGQESGSIIFPIRIERLRWLKPLPDKIRCILTAVKDTKLEISSDLLITNLHDEPFVEIEGFRCRRLHPASNEGFETTGKLYSEEWERLPERRAQASGEPAALRRFLIVTQAKSWGRTIADALEPRANETHVACLAKTTLRKADHFDVLASRTGFNGLFEILDSNFTDVVFTTGTAPARASLGAERLESACTSDLIAAVTLIQAMSDSDHPPRLHIVTTGAIALNDEIHLDFDAIGQTALIGLARTVATEMPDLRPRVIDVDPLELSLDALIEELLNPDDETEVVLRQDARYAPRLVGKRYEDLPRRRKRWNPNERFPAFKVGMHAPGLLERITRTEMVIPTPKADEVLVEVQYAGLNFRDIMAATNLLPPEAEEEPAWEHLGLECSGIIRAVGSGVSPKRVGQSVVVIAPNCLASHVVLPSEAAFAVPSDADLQVAASIPIAFSTAHHSLITLAHLARDERVLIHSAAGGVGLAAINIAHAVGAEVIATAGSEDKRAYLRQVGVKHVFDSRSLAFVDQIKALTRGRGVDVILNSLPNAFLQGSLSLLAPSGRFVEIGKRDIYADTSIGLRPLRDNASIFVVDLARLALDRPALLASEVKCSLHNLNTGVVAPIPITHFRVGAVAEAFRYMARASHIGKVVVAFDDTLADVELSERSSIVVKDAAYIVTGGTRGFGLTIAAALVQRGARSLILVGRSINLPPESQSMIETLRKSGANVVVVSADISTAEGVNEALQAARSTGQPLRGVVHAAGVIHSALIRDLDKDSIQNVFAAKVLGAWYLHKASLEDQLDFFVCCSSISAILGPLGQAHYAAANRALDTIALIRRARGLPGLSINFGPIAGAGFLMEQEELAKFLDQSGISATSAEDCCDLILRMLVRDSGSVTFAAVDGSRLAIALPALQSPRTAALVAQLRTGNGHFGKIRQELIASRDADRPAFLFNYFRNLIAAVLKIERESIAVDQPLSDLGLDSLTIFEMKNRVELEMGISVPVGRLLQRPAIDQIVPDMLRQLDQQLGAGLNGGEQPVEGIAENGGSVTSTAFACMEPRATLV